MKNDFYKHAFESAISELTTLTAEREKLHDQIGEIDRRIEKLRHGAVSIAALSDLDFNHIKTTYPDLFAEQLDVRTGITDAVREALRRARKWVAMPELRNEVFQIAPNVAAHKNPDASIYSVLRRLIDNYEVIEGGDAIGRNMYAWIATDEAIEHLRKACPEKAKESFEKVVSGLKKKQARGKKQRSD